MSIPSPTPLKSQSDPMDGFKELRDAEDYFDFFSLPFDPRVLDTSRLHILKAFSDSIADIQQQVGSDPSSLWSLHRQALQNAYALFQVSSGVEQKLFAVFQRRPGHIVSLDSL